MDYDIVFCLKLSVDCVANDPIEIKNGGPDMIGFDFFVEENAYNDMLNYVVSVLDEFDVPFKTIYSCGKYRLSQDEVWNKDMIRNCIVNEADMIKNEYKKEYTLKYMK